MELSAGSVFADRYRLDSHLGSGGMGIVWAAVRTDDDQPVALKFMKAAEDQATLRRRFLREARAACAIEHPNVVRIYDVLDLPEAPVIVMERLNGESLAERLARDGPMTPAEAARVVLPVTSAVSAAHVLGIVHRDLKPDNIFIGHKDDSTLVKVLDFGIAKLVGAQAAAAATAHATTTGAMLGTPAYMPPEQVFGEKDIDHRADVWSLGMILYECLTGVLPTRADNVGQVIKIILTRDDWRLAEVAPDLPEDLVELVGRMLSRERSRRPDLREVGEVLARYAGTSTPDIRSAPPPPSLKRHLGFASTVRAPADSSSSARTNPREEAPRKGRKAIAVSLGVAAVAMAGLWLLVHPGASDPPSGAQPETVESAAGAPIPASAAPLRPNPVATAKARPSEATPAESAKRIPAPRPRTHPRPRTGAAKTPQHAAASAKPQPSQAAASPAPSHKTSTLQNAVVDSPPF